MTAVHATENRYINVREFMHLMGLPHDFEVTDPGHTEFRNITARQKVILAVSQNVPVCTGKKNESCVVGYKYREMRSTKIKSIAKGLMSLLST